MDRVEPVYDVGVIVGRFQVSELHDGHRDLIDSVCTRHRKVVVLLGCSPIPNSVNDPLDFQAREWMLRDNYPHLLILPINDQPSDDHWSVSLDQIVSSILGPNQNAVLYGSRDSFMKHYSGRFDTIELVARHQISGTEHRTEIGRSIRGSADWRAGVIFASQQHFPTCYSTVDIAIFDAQYEFMLLGKKPNEDLWRLPGGFSDPASESFEEDAIREAREETSLDVSPVKYLGSFTIDDWRYRSGPNCIKTMLFAGAVANGTAEAGDDLAEVKWFDLKDLTPDRWRPVMRGHMKLVDRAVLYASNVHKKI